MAVAPERNEAAKWTPVTGSTWRGCLGKVLSVPAYPYALIWAVSVKAETTTADARKWRNIFLGLGAAGSIVHAYFSRKFSDASPTKRILLHSAMFLMVDHTNLWMAYLAHSIKKVLAVDRRGNRLVADKLHGPRVLVVGNGPSAVEGAELGSEIDKFDEVVRFNNFQTKVAGMEKWVGTKTTVHYSDGVLYPTYTEYHAPGATIMLSLFMDRFLVAGSYLIQRGATDLQMSLTMKFLTDPTLYWMEKEQIEQLKAKLGLKGIKHPTSGMLAIDYFLNKKGVKLPVYIHGFDFFQGPKVHYFDEHEPLHERINDRIGVNMHDPIKEKVYVEKLIAEGKVKFLKDL